LPEELLKSVTIEDSVSRNSLFVPSFGGLTLCLRRYGRGELALYNQERQIVRLLKTFCKTRQVT